MTEIEEKRRQRTAFMRALYQATDGNEHEHVTTQELTESIGIDRSQVTSLIQYLEGE